MPIIDRNSAKAKICPLNLHLLFCDFPCWYVTWAQIVKLQNGISSRRQKVPGPKDEIISGFAIPLFAPIIKICPVLMACTSKNRVLLAVFWDKISIFHLGQTKHS